MATKHLLTVHYQTSGIQKIIYITDRKDQFTFNAMTNHNSLNRRRFIGAAAAATGGILFSGSESIVSGKPISENDFPSTEHFWYFKPPDVPYIDSQKKNRSFGFSDNEIFLSEDNSHTWKYRNNFPDAANITFSHIFENGNILFATLTKLFLSTDNLASYKEIILKNQDGTDYLPHTPKNPENPGWYFMSLSGVNSWKINNKEVLAWGNYGNVAGGATPSNIYYSVDNGHTVKIAYAFGQNPYRRDNGAAGGEEGKMLGIPAILFSADIFTVWHIILMKMHFMPVPAMVTGLKD